MTGAVAESSRTTAGRALTVVPLRAGGGTRLKILESMALGRCVVSTTAGCEGLGFTDGRELLVADGAVAFARQTRTLLRSEERRPSPRHGSSRGRAAYDWDAIADRLLDLYGGSRLADDGRSALLLLPNDRFYGGGELVAAWMLQALAEECDLTVSRGRGAGYRGAQPVVRDGDLGARLRARDAAEGRPRAAQLRARALAARHACSSTPC